ncbi:tryptophan--tRNA ligase [Candidatus Kaiserbacteria bacterium]|nr:tryptophan--tRNA ligase [Candidatus Kaiserbacteria bacterium]
MSEIVLSGIRATGKLHFGNLMGAVQHFVRFQGRGDTCLFFVADLHTLTTLQDPDDMRRNLREIVKDYLAAGLDPQQSILYAQSSVPEIPELSLLLSMLQPLGDLLRIPTFKEKVRGQDESATLGLVTYPVLMAADILGPKATLVPVGEDQVPNVELARRLAHIFNARFGETFVIPSMMDEMVKVPGLDGAKMGKSDGNAIDINAPISEISTLYKKRGVTDPKKVRAGDPGNPYRTVDIAKGVDEGCRSVYAVHELITPGEKEGREIADECRAGTIGCADCKERLVGSIAAILGPFQEKRAALANQDDYVIDVLHEGGKRARVLIAPTVEAVREKMGVIIY